LAFVVPGCGFRSISRGIPINLTVVVHTMTLLTLTVRITRRSRFRAFLGLLKIVR